MVLPTDFSPFQAGITAVASGLAVMVFGTSFGESTPASGQAWTAFGIVLGYGAVFSTIGVLVIAMAPVAVAGHKAAVIAGAAAAGWRRSCRVSSTWSTR